MSQVMSTAARLYLVLPHQQGLSQVKITKQTVGSICGGQGMGNVEDLNHSAANERCIMPSLATSGLKELQSKSHTSEVE